jgi:signal transduction histidine kinase
LVWAGGIARTLAPPGPGGKRRLVRCSLYALPGFFQNVRVVTLANSKLLGPLPPDVLAALLAASRERRFAVGSEIFREGDAGDGVYVVREGRVEISGAVGPGRRHTFGHIEPGELFGEMAVIEDKPRSATATATADSTIVLFIPRAAMLVAVRHSPELALFLLREISNRLREFNHVYLAELLQTERLAIVGRFARTIIHDLKNPLTIIGLTAEVAGMDSATPEMRQQAQKRIRRQVERISDLIGEILDFTQGTAAAFEHTPANYAAFVEQAIAEIGSEIEVKGITLAFETPPPPVVVQFNPKRLRRVLQNLIHNATDVMPDGGLVRLRFEIQGGDVITEIEDTGPAIPPEIAGRLFEAFTTHGKAHGTGLGLSICKKIIEDHGGQIWTRPEPGHGAIFAFKLPFVRQA